MIENRRARSASIAANWSDGTIVGTGVVGGVLFGSPQRHTVVFSHERFFVPANSRRSAPVLAPVLDDVRKALAQRDESAAADIVERRLRDVGWDPDELIWTDPLGPIAQLEWIPATEEYSRYERSIALDTGDAEVSWADGRGARAGITLITEHGTDWVDVELWSESDCVGRLILSAVTETAADIHVITPVDYSNRVRASVTVNETEQTLVLDARGLEAGNDLQATATLTCDSEEQVLGAEGGWRVRLHAGIPRRYRVRVATSAASVGTLTPLQLPRALSASRLTLTSGTGASASTVEEIWDNARAGDENAELEVFELAYSAGRRNIVASTGALPPTLQGVWQGTWAPAWSADYTMNGNLQLGGLADVLWTGNPELMKSLFRLVVPFADHYRSNARNVFGLPGMLLPARLSTHGHANHFLREFPHEFWLGSGPWLLRMAADYIQVTGDSSPVDEWLWDFACEILEFSLAAVRAGGGHLTPSYSPENCPAGSENPLATDATADIAAIRDGLKVGAWLADVKGEAERARAWRSARERLPKYGIAEDGTLAEWSTSWQEQVAHRHVSQLQGLWYRPDEAFTEPALRAAAAATIRAKIAWRSADPVGPPGRMEMAFGLTSVGLAATHLGEAEHAYVCALWLARDHFTPALTSTHDAMSVFNLDASGGLPALVAAMLLDSSCDTLRLLPALPAAWCSGRITGLTGRGAVRVRSMGWTADGVEADIILASDGDWLRRDGTTVELPRPGRLIAGTIEQLTERTLWIPPGATSATLQFRYAPRSGECPKPSHWRQRD